MARSHGRISVSIWSDPDWLALPMHAQWLYMTLVSQPEINHAGVVALTPRRWARLCADRDPDLVADALKILADHRFLVVDEDDEQLLVRTFVRHDGVAAQPNVLKSACESARLVTSAPLRAALVGELRRLDQTRIGAMRAAPGQAPVIVALRATIEALSLPAPPSPPPLSATPSEGYDEPNGQGSRQPFVEAGCEPYGEPPTRRRAGEGAGEGVSVEVPNPLSADGCFAPRAKKTITGQDRAINRVGPPHSPTAHRLVETYAATCNRRPPAKILSQLAVETDALLTEDWPDDDIDRALTAWGSKALGPGALQAVAHEVVNRRPGPSRSRTANAVAATEAAWAELEARYAAAPHDTPSNVRQLPTRAEGA